VAATGGHRRDDNEVRMRAAQALVELGDRPVGQQVQAAA
jgi:hypothetical protein